MIRNAYRRYAPALWPAAVLMLAGCAGQSPRTDFYMLSVADSPALPQAVAAGCDRVPITIGPVTWPRYLDQPRIVTRTGPNSLEFNEFNRWAGSLRDDFGRALRKNLTGLLETERLSSYGDSARLPSRYRVELVVEQFDGALDGEVVLDVKWAVFAQTSGEPVGMPHATIVREPVTAPGYAGLAEASSKAVAGLAREIAAELAGICANTPE